MRKRVYWISTIFVAFIMTTSGVLALTHAPAMMKALAHLGYPAYFSDVLGVAKLAGACVLLVPGWARLKEWSYVGFGITILSACYSHLLSGDGFLALEPLITFVALVTSYVTRPSDRTFFLSTNTSLDRPLDGAGMARRASREVYSHGRNTQ
jgi:hypothetical protein